MYRYANIMLSSFFFVVVSVCCILALVFMFLILFYFTSINYKLYNGILFGGWWFLLMVYGNKKMECIDLSQIHNMKDG